MVVSIYWKARVPRMLGKKLGLGARRVSLLWLLLTCAAAIVLLTKPIFYIYVEDHDDSPGGPIHRMWNLNVITNTNSKFHIIGILEKEDVIDDTLNRNPRSSRARAVNESCQTGLAQDKVSFGDREAVERYNASIAGAYQNILVDDNLKVLYCVVPKVACTNWKRMLVLLSGKLNFTTTAGQQVRGIRVHDKTYMRFMGLRHLNEYNQAEVALRMRDYFKFMFVRHPFERLLSAYRDKFTQHDKWSRYFQKRYGRKIIQRYRSDANWKSLHYGNDVKFEEFINYVVDRSRAGLPLNPHWAPYHTLCQPCYIHYDFIGKFETLKDDAKVIVNSISPNYRDMRFPPSWRAGPDTHAIMDKYFRNISWQQIRELYLTYQKDFNMFRYEKPHGLY